MSRDLVIEATGLGFSYRAHKVLEDISFTASSGESVAFLGPSGCGKTTLLHLIAGIHRGFEGLLVVRTDRISYVFQHDTLLGWRTALGNVLLPFELSGKPVTRALREKGRRLFGELGLAGAEDLAPSQLSGGMKKRVELARALITDPELLILDEPFSSLDLITRERLNVLLRQVHAHARATMVLVTHSVEEACFLAERVHVLAGHPATIIDFEEPGKSRNGLPDQFLLSRPEADAAANIRRGAKVLWTIGGDNGAEANRDGVNGGDTGEGEGGPSRSPVLKAGAFLRRHYAGFLIPLELLLFLALIAVLKGSLAISDIILPHPASVVQRFFSTLQSGSILPDLLTTIYESLAGFLLAFIMTLLTGYGIAKSRLASTLLMPWLVAANTIPSVALAPFLVLWLSFGLAPRVVTAVIVVFFPMLVNTISAVKLAERATGELAAFFRPRPLRRFTRFELPASLPVIASGVKVSITLSVIGAVVGEFVSGSRGLGAMVTIAKANFDIDLAFVGLVWLMLLGLSYYGIANGLHWLVAGRLRRYSGPTWG